MLKPLPCRIEPIFSPRPWGARSLAPLFPEKTNLQEPLGEAWLTALESRMANGPFAGRPLGESWRAMPPEWRGKRVSFSRDFPLLVKFLFPNDKLSIQVHPDDEYASKYEQAAGGRGKTEMWHIVSAQPGAELLIGLKPAVTREKFIAAIADDTVEELFVRHEVKAGESYFVPAGTQHAICPGMVVCEVQEYSDLTYRVYDYGRLDSAGKARELHIEKALKVTKFEGTRGGIVPPVALPSPDARKHLLAACEYFATELWDCDRTTFIESNSQEFQLMIVLRGSGQFRDAERLLPYRSGQAWFLPASLPAASLEPVEQTSLLRITVPDLSLVRHQLEHQGIDKDALSRVLFG